MNEYSLLIRRDMWIFKNHFKEIKQNPKRLLVYIFYILWFGLMIFNTLMQSRTNTLSSFKQSFGPQLVGAFVTIFFGALFFYSLLSGLNKGATFFNLGDVNLLFPSPMSPKKILFYHMIRQSILYMFIGLFAIMFIPQITMVTEVNFNYIVFIYIAFGSYIIAIEPLNLLLFSIGSKFNVHSLIKKIAIGIMTLLSLFILGKSLLHPIFWEGFLKSINETWILYIPVIGWIKAMFMTPITGYTTYSMVAVILQILFIIVCLGGVYVLGEDYYEDVIGATEKRETLKRRKRGIERKKKISIQLRKGKSIEVKKVGTGPWALFWRAKVEYSKTSIHPYFSMSALGLVIMAVVVSLIGNNFTDDSPRDLVYLTNGLIAYFLFIFSATLSLDTELDKPYIFLIPGSPIFKMIATMGMDVIRMSIGIGFYNFILVFSLKVSIVDALIMSIFVISFYILSNSSQFFVRVIFPNAVDRKTLFPLFLMIQMLLLLIPSGIVAIIVGIFFHTVSAVLLGIGITNIIVALVVLLLANVIFEFIEWR